MRSSPRHAGRPAAVDLDDDDAIVAGLRAGDEAVFERLVAAWSPAMIRLALVHAPNRAVCDEVVQECWLTVLRDLDRFEGRSSLRTWVLGVLVNLARARARAERRSTPVALDDDAPLFDERRFRGADDPFPHHWAIGPTPWPTPERALLAGEAREVILRAIAELPAAQREVLVLRDMQGWPADETCNVLGLTDTNQRVLLHRARTRVRQALEDYFDATEPT